MLMDMSRCLVGIENWIVGRRYSSLGMGMELRSISGSLLVPLLREEEEGGGGRGCAVGSRDGRG